MERQIRRTKRLNAQNGPFKTLLRIGRESRDYIDVYAEVFLRREFVGGEKIFARMLSSYGFENGIVLGLRVDAYAVDPVRLQSFQFT